MHKALIMRHSSCVALLVAALGMGAGTVALADESVASGDVIRTLGEHRADLCRCVERGVDSGRLIPVVMRFEISVRNKAVNTEIEVGDDIPVSVSRCMKKSLERIRFPEGTAFSVVEHKMSFLNTKLDRPRRR